VHAAAARGEHREERAPHGVIVTDREFHSVPIRDTSVVIAVGPASQARDLDVVRALQSPAACARSSS
jgi:hypothetical protein